MLIANTEDLEFEDYEVYLQTIPGLDAQYNQAHSRPQNYKKMSVFYGAGL